MLDRNAILSRWMFTLRTYSLTIKTLRDMRVNVKVRTTYQKFSVKKHGRMHLKQAYFGEFRVKRSQPVSGKSQQRRKQLRRSKARWRGQACPISKESQGHSPACVAGIKEAEGAVGGSTGCGNSIRFILSGMKSHRRILKRRVRQPDLQYKKYTKHSKQSSVISYRSKRIISFPLT